MAKKIITYMMGFLLFIAMLGLLVLIVFSNTILNKQYILHNLEKSNYFEKIYFNIKNEFENYTIQSGIDENDLEGIHTKEQVEVDIRNVIDAIYEGKDITINSAIIAENIDKKVNDILQENNRMPDKNEKEVIKKFEDALVNVYEQNIVYEADYIKKLKELVNKAHKFVKSAIITLMVINIVLILLIAIINKNSKEIEKQLGISLLATGMVVMLFKIFLEEKIQNILVLNKAFSTSIIMLINNIINTFFIAGIIIAIIGFISIIMSNKKRNKKELENK